MKTKEKRKPKIRSPQNYLRRFFARIKPRLIDDNFRYYLQMTLVPAITAAVSLIMCVVNVFSDKRILIFVTAAFSVCSFIETIITYFFLKDKIRVAFVWFTLNIMILFNYFIIFGGAEGFSAIWLLLMPSFLCFFIGFKGGLIGSGIMLAELIFFFWTPAGQSLLICKDYTESFLMRFPIIYIVCFALGVLLEILRKLTYSQMHSVEEAYRSVSTIDSLSGIYNRYWLDSYMNNCIRQYDGSFFCLMMIDIDRFKDFNDTYGHLVGDEILKQTAKILLREKGPNATVARWGGEEFIMFGVADNKTDAENKAENLRKTIENSHFDAGETLRGCSLHVTVSIGVACNKCDRGIKYGNILKIADDAMYYSKSRGKNTVTVREF